MKGARVRLAALLLAVILLLVGAACDSDDDSSTNAGQAQDDDSAASGTDDDDDDDDLADDDDDDNDDNDDDNDDDASPQATALLVVGEVDGEVTSFLQTADGWLEQPIPPATDHYNTSFGPMAVAGGAVGHAIWNSSNWWYYPGHEWLNYSPSDGWRLDPDRPGNSWMVNGLVAFETAPPLVGEYWDMGFKMPMSFQFLYRYPTSGRRLMGFFTDSLVGAMAFPTPDEGLVGVYNSLSFDGTLLRYDHGKWEDLGLPLGLTGGRLLTLSLTDLNNGWAAWLDAGKARKTLALHDGEWSEVAPPVGCEDLWPSHFAGRAGYAIALRGGFDYADGRFEEFRDNVWTCRTVGDDAAAPTLRSATLWSDGRVFLAGYSQQPAYESRMWEVTGEELIPLDPPPALTALYLMRSIGPLAPAQE